MKCRPLSVGKFRTRISRSLRGAACIFLLVIAVTQPAFSETSDVGESFQRVDLSGFGKSFENPIVKGIGLKKALAAWRVRYQLFAEAGALVPRPNNTDYGLTLHNVRPDGFFDKIGFRNGDIIREIDGSRVENLDTIERALLRAYKEWRVAVKVIVKRGDEERYVKIRAMLF